MNRRDGSSPTAASLWRPWGWRSRLLGLMFLVSQVFMATSDGQPVGTEWLNLVALSMLGTALILLGLPVDDPYPRGLALAVAGLAISVTLLEASVPHDGGGLYTNWHLGASIFVLMVLAMRAPIGLIWLSFALVGTIEVTCVSLQGEPITGTLVEMARHAGSVVVAWIVAVGIARTAARLRELAEIRSRREAREAVRREIAVERSTQIDRIETTAGALLRRLSGGPDLSDEERAECLLVEASLRDSMSGRGLASPDVLAAARSARERGVRVVLLDDSHGLNPHRLAVAGHVVRVLNELRDGSCTVRLQPSGRANVVSITVDDAAGGRVIELTAAEVGTL